MSDLAKALANKEFQKEISRLLEARPTYQVDPNLPDALQKKLEELDRVTAKKPEP